MNFNPVKEISSNRLPMVNGHDASYPDNQKLTSNIQLIHTSPKELQLFKYQQDALTTEQLAEMIAYCDDNYFGTYQVDYAAIEKLSKNKNIDKHDLILLAKKFKDYLNSKPGCLSLSQIIIRQHRRSKNDFLDFFNKNNNLSKSNRKLLTIFESHKSAKTEIMSEIERLYKAFYISDKFGREEIENIEALGFARFSDLQKPLETNGLTRENEKFSRKSQIKLLAADIFSEIAAMALTRKLNKLAMLFSLEINKTHLDPNKKKPLIGLTSSVVNLRPKLFPLKPEGNSKDFLVVDTPKNTLKSMDVSLLNCLIKEEANGNVPPKMLSFN